MTEYGIEVGYSAVTIDYFPTSVNRLYKIDEGEWKTYDGEIRLEVGQVIYAKGIDKNGTETRTISSYKSVLPSDALGPAAYDGKEETYYENASLDAYINVDSSMIGKKVRIKFKINAYSRPRVDFMDINNKNISSAYAGYAAMFEQILTIPQGTTKIRLKRR